MVKASQLLIPLSVINYFKGKLLGLNINQPLLCVTTISKGSRGIQSQCRNSFSILRSRRVLFSDLFRILGLHISGRGLVRMNKFRAKKSWYTAESHPRQMKSNFMKQVFILYTSWPGPIAVLYMVHYIAIGQPSQVPLLQLTSMQSNKKIKLRCKSRFNWCGRLITGLDVILARHGLLLGYPVLKLLLRP